MPLLNIINLKSRKDRLELIKQEISEQGITPMFWDGIIHPNSRTGICRAHKQIVRFAQMNNFPSTIIAEDDLHFTSPNGWNYFLSQIPESYDLFLGGVYSGFIIENKVSKFSGLTLYSISSRFYDIFLSMPENINIDNALGGKGEYFVCSPFVCKQHNGFSDNVKKEVNYDNFLKKKKFL